MFTQPPLPYGFGALTPHISEENLRLHYGKHHASYVTNLNKLTANTDLAGKSLEELIRTQKGGVFNNAAQIWNHTFYFEGMAPGAGGEPTGALAEAIVRDFGSFAAFKEQFSTKALKHFGSGWVWLVQDAATKKLEIMDTHDAANPLQTPGKKPLLTIDTWEHAWYVTHKNRKPDYVAGWWHLINWPRAASLYAPSARL